MKDRETLADLARHMRAIAEHVVELEGRSPSWNSLPADTVTQLERLAERIVATEAREAGAQDALVRRVEALEARTRPSGLDASNEQHKARGEALRGEIAQVLQAEPEATAPRVIEALRPSHADNLPSLRTVRWHMAALRNGNGNANSIAT